MAKMEIKHLRKKKIQIQFVQHRQPLVSLHINLHYIVLVHSLLIKRLPARTFISAEVLRDIPVFHSNADLY